MWNIFKSFGFAIKGILFCLIHERNMRIHTVIAAYVLIFSTFFDLNKIEYAILIITLALVMGAEMINTAVENLVDLAASSYNNLAKIAKDVAAGAVLVFAVASIGVSLCLFWDVPVFIKIYEYFISHIFALIAFIISIAVAVFYIILGPVKVSTVYEQQSRKIKTKMNNKTKEEKKPNAKK